MRHRRRLTVVAVAAIAVLGAFASVGSASTTSSADADDGNEVPITGSALDTATAAALAHLGEGRVTETEVGDEDSYYEVEVTLDNGSQVDVQLDEGFTVVGTEADGPNDD